MHRKSVIVLVVTSLVLSFALAALRKPLPRLHPLKNLQILRLQPLNPKAGP